MKGSRIFLRICNLSLRTLGMVRLSIISSSGHILIFNERMIHTVMKNGETDGALKRFHTSFVISSCDIALHNRQCDFHLAGQLVGMKHKKKDKNEKTLIDYFAEQRIVPVRSGQGTPTYSNEHIRFHGKKIESLSLIYADHCLDKRLRVH